MARLRPEPARRVRPPRRTLPSTLLTCQRSYSRTMRVDVFLKELQMSGFKSFAQTVQLQLEPGVTAVVGPNGSGKSNIVDAVRWVLGEQSARVLRGAKSEDVIFAGSAMRRPLGMAEVTLVL